LWLWNGDVAAVQLQWRLIRGGLTFDWNHGNGTGNTVAAYANTATPHFPNVLMAGDQLQVKVPAITVPGAAVLRLYVEKMYAAA
jgi:hypothetical protein